MADPTGYEPDYSFSGYQANNPSSPLPAARVDAEYAAIAASIGTMVAAIMSVRRSDGALNNNIVTFDSLHESLQFLVDPTNGELVAAAVEAAQAAATAAGASATSAATQASAAAVSAAAAAASASSVNLSLYLAKANNLEGLGSLSTSRSNLGLGSSAVLDVGITANKVLQLDGSAKIPAVDGSQLTNILTAEPGSIQWFPANAAPTGFLKCDGSLVSRATYARLYAFAAASGNIVAEASWSANSGGFSSGDLSTTFRLPDLRGEFIRGWDDSRGVDSGRAIGTRQADMLKDHTHNYTDSSGGQHGSSGVPGGVIVGATATSGVNSPNNGGTETRPRNVALLACIKY